MENKNKLKNDDEMSEGLFPGDLALPTELFTEFIETIITENPELKKLSLFEPRIFTPHSFYRVTHRRLKSVGYSFLDFIE